MMVSAQTHIFHKPSETLAIFVEKDLKKKHNSTTEKRINIESFENEGIKNLYQHRLTEKLNRYELETTTDTKKTWKNVKAFNKQQKKH